jgi:hypothetical protein
MADMRVYLLSLGAGLLVGIIYSLLDVRSRETALRLWTENVTWFSNEEGNKGRIEAGQLADLIVPDRDYFACAESEIADTVSELTIVGGRIVYAGRHLRESRCPPPPAMPDWSPVRRFGGYAARGEQGRERMQRQPLDEACGCASGLQRPRPQPQPRLDRHGAGLRPQVLLGRARLLLFRVLRPGRCPRHPAMLEPVDRLIGLILQAPATAAAARIVLCLPSLAATAPPNSTAATPIQGICRNVLSAQIQRVGRPNS